MSIVTFNKSQYNDQKKKQNQLFKTLQEQNEHRFSYPFDPSYGATNSDLLKTLLPITWNKISFPVSRVSTEITHDTVQHKYPHRDGARLESMGRNPFIIKATAIFANTINPGKNETWEKGTLYPNVYKQMLSESLKDETQVLKHPFMGIINAKLVSFLPDLDAKFRGGEIVEITWIETITDDEFDYFFDQLDRAAIAATYLDLSFEDLDPDPRKLGLPEYKKGLNDLLNDVKASLDQTTRTIEGAYSTAPFDELYGRCNDIIKSTKNLGEASYAFVTQSATILKSIATIFKTQSENVNALTPGSIKSLSTIAVSTLSSYTSFTKNSIDELMFLNKKLLRKPTIPANSIIRYYKK